MNSRRRRLLSLNTYHYRRGGSDVAFLEHDSLFAGLGWDTAVFAMQHPKNQPSAWADYFVDELELGSDYSIPRKLVMAGKVIYSFEARRKLAKLLDRFTPDVAHTHCIYHHLSPSVLSLLHERGIPSVMTAHDLKIACPAYKMFNERGMCERCKHGNLIHVAAQRCVHGSLALSTLVMIESVMHRFLSLYRNNLDRIIAPSRFYRQKLEEWGWPSGKIVYIPNYIDANCHSPQYAPGDYYLYFGRLAPEKGIETLIESAARLDIQVKIVGSGPVEHALRELARPTSKVEFLGHCAGERLWDLVRGARAIVLPSRWYENAPLSVLEAFAVGKPVIGARIGGITELVREGECGFLFESGDVDDLSRTIQTVESLADARVADMGRAARHHVCTNFTRGQYLERTLDLYESLGAGVCAAGGVGSRT